MLKSGGDDIKICLHNEVLDLECPLNTAWNITLCNIYLLFIFFTKKIIIGRPMGGGGGSKPYGSPPHQEYWNMTISKSWFEQSSHKSHSKNTASLKDWLFFFNIKPNTVLVDEASDCYTILKMIRAYWSKRWVVTNRFFSELFSTKTV